MSQNLKQLKQRFKKTMKAVAKLIGIPASTLRREDYLRVSVDTGLEGRLNKEELNLLGGFKEARNLYFEPITLKVRQPKVLILDIETAPIIACVWGLFKQNIGLNMIQSDWHVLSWAAKWLGDDEIFYMDQRNAKNIEDDKKILKGIWKLIDEADVIITQNGVSFDTRKLNARFILNGIQPPSYYKNIDTLKIAKKYFKFTSNKLEYMTDQLCTKYKKLSHGKYPGFKLWSECLKGNLEAWAEMEEYNKYDILSLEELYHKLSQWDQSINFNIYHDQDVYICRCGSQDFKKSGFYYTNTGKFQKYTCNDCGAESRDTANMFSKNKKNSLRRSVK